MRRGRYIGVDQMNEKTRDTVVRFDGETGEILAEFQMDSDDSITTGKRIGNKIRYVKNQTDMGKLTEKLNGCYFILYYNNELFDGLVSEKNLARLIFLATHLDYDTNLLITKRGKQKCAMTEVDMKVAMNLNPKTFKQFIEEIKTCGILTINDGKYYLSDKYFMKGSGKKPKNYTRVYIYSIQFLYTHCKGKQHTRLAQLFKLLPYVDYQHNCVTKYPNTPNALLKPMTKTEIAEMIGIDPYQFRDFEKAITKITLTFDGMDYYVVGYAKFKAGCEEEKTYYVVNPLIFNSNKEYATLKEVWTQLLIK